MTPLGAQHRRSAHGLIRASCSHRCRYAAPPPEIKPASWITSTRSRDLSCRRMFQAFPIWASLMPHWLLQSPEAPGPALSSSSPCWSVPFPGITLLPSPAGSHVPPGPQGQMTRAQVTHQLEGQREACPRSAVTLCSGTNPASGCPSPHDTRGHSARCRPGLQQRVPGRPSVHSYGGGGVQSKHSRSQVPTWKKAWGGPMLFGYPCVHACKCMWIRV